MAAEGRDAKTVAVLGPGGVGGLLAALLARAGHRVICLAGPDTAEVLNLSGIRVRSRQYGDFTAAVEAAGELTEPVDACLIAVKSTGLVAALQRVPQEVLGDAPVLPLLNGFEHMAALRSTYRPEQVAAGVIRVESTRVAPGVIEHATAFSDVDVASRTAPRQVLDGLVALLSGAGIRSRVVDDEPTALWTKLSFLAPMALLSTRYGLPLGGVRTERRDEMLALVEETTAAGRAEGAVVDAAATIRMCDAAPADAWPSMRRDAEAGRPLELDTIGGAVLRAARRHDLAAPVIERLVHDLTPAAGTP